MKRAQIIAWTAPVALVLTLGAAGAGLTSGLEWKRGPASLIGSLCAHVALRASAMTPARTVEPPTPPAAEPQAQPVEVADTSAVIRAQPEPVVDPATVTVEAEGTATERDLVDYATLNQDVLVVADTLERFNQKLLRIIAQARAAQLRADAQAAADARAKADLDTAVSQAPPVPVPPLEIKAAP